MGSGTDSGADSAADSDVGMGEPLVRGACARRDPTSGELAVGGAYVKGRARGHAIQSGDHATGPGSQADVAPLAGFLPGAGHAPAGPNALRFHRRWPVVRRRAGPAWSTGGTDLSYGRTSTAQEDRYGTGGLVATPCS
ncbi:hypothetical protein GCM10023324_63750 [Streptomyces youssoufiensis]